MPDTDRIQYRFYGSRAFPSPAPGEARKLSRFFPFVLVGPLEVDAGKTTPIKISDIRTKIDFPLQKPLAILVVAGFKDFHTHLVLVVLMVSSTSPSSPMMRLRSCRDLTHVP